MSNRTDWHDLADLPFAAVLTMNRGGLAPDAVYDCDHFDQVSFDDLRGAELGVIIGPDSLRGAIISTAQLVYLAPLLAEIMGIKVSDD